MPKVFLSHSSADKASYIDIVANRLSEQFGSYNIVYDKYTFEEGLITLDEISKNLEESNLFVIFISEKALQSDWVKKELVQAEELLKESKLERIYPIIIDSKIKYNDPRIPEWMQNVYNIKFVSRPNKSVQLIRERMIEISWKFHPKLKERNKIFVGRNMQINSFEERLDDYEKGVPNCIVVSGIYKIGRRSYLKHCITKSNIANSTYQPLTMKLLYQDSIEDFIYSLYDLGYSDCTDIKSLLTKTVEEKVDYAITMIGDIQKANEIVFIEDRGCIIDYEGKMSPWFFDIIKGIPDKSKMTICVIAQFNMNMYDMWKYDNIFNVALNELEKKEREGLLNRYLNMEEIVLEVEDFKYIAGLFVGYPEQVIYAVDLLDKFGIGYLKANSHLVAEYSKRKVSILLEEYENQAEVMEYLCLLSSFDQIGIDFIAEIVDNNDKYFQLLNDFANRSICEYVGSNKEYIKINDIIKDYIQRSDYKVGELFTSKLKESLEKFLKNPSIDEYTMPEFLFNMKEAMVNGETVDHNYVIPSLYLKSMKELYEKRGRYNDVIKFAHKALENEQYMDESIVFEIRYLLCLSLAKTQNNEMLTEVQKIRGADHNFLKGFYYRQIGKADKALIEYNKSLEIRTNYSKAKRELVQVYIMLQEYDRAKVLAKEHYESNSENAYHIQAYFMCLIKGEKSQEIRGELEKLLENLNSIKSEKAKEMYLRCKAQFEAFYNEDEELAISIINQDIKEYPYLNFAYMVKFDICEKFNRIEDMKEIVKHLQSIDAKRYHNNIVCFQSIISALEGKVHIAVEYFEKNIRNYTDQAKDRFTQNLIMKYKE